MSNKETAVFREHETQVILLFRASPDTKWNLPRARTIWVQKAW